MLSSLVMLWTDLAWSACPASVSEMDLEGVIARAEDSVRGGDNTSLSASIRALWRALPCAMFPVSGDMARRIHIVSGIDAFGQGESDMARRHFWSAQEIRPGPLELTPARALQDAWQDIPGSDPFEPLPKRPLSVLVDGRSVRVVPLGRPYIEQHLDGAEIVWSNMRWPDKEIEEIRVMRDQAAWALQDLELAWRFLELRVASGHRIPGVRLQGLVRADLGVVRELVGVAERSLLLEDATNAATAARRVVEQRWSEISAEPWSGLSGEELDLIEIRALRRRSLTALDAALRLTARETTSDPLVVSLYVVTGAVYSSSAPHEAVYHTERSELLSKASSPPRPEPLAARKLVSDGLADVSLLAVDFSARRPAGTAELLDPFGLVRPPPSSSKPSSSLLEISETEWSKSSPKGSELKSIDWDER